MPVAPFNGKGTVVLKDVPDAGKVFHLGSLRFGDEPCENLRGHLSGITIEKQPVLASGGNLPQASPGSVVADLQFFVLVAADEGFATLPGPTHARVEKYLPPMVIFLQTPKAGLFMSTVPFVPKSKLYSTHLAFEARDAVLQGVREKTVI
jgi:hypothetical protein